MIINNSHEFIYIHVPKTAGTSLRRGLHAYAGPEDLYLGDGVDYDDWDETRHFGAFKRLAPIWKEVWQIGKHSPVRYLRRKLAARVWESYFKFAFVRNPFSRTWSGFQYVRKMKAMDGIFVDMSFSEFLRSEHFRDKPILPVGSQVYFLHPLREVDYIGRFETLAADMAQIVSIIERRPVRAVALDRLNASAEPEAWKGMSDADRAIIREVLEKDFQVLGYSPEDGSIVRPIAVPDPAPDPTPRPARAAGARPPA